MNGFWLWAPALLAAPLWADTLLDPRLEVLVYDHGRAHSAHMERAAAVAISIFRKAGANLVWHDCRGQSCPTAFGANFVVVQVLRREQRAKLQWPLGACGLALVDGDLGFYAFVDYDCVIASAGSGMDTGHVLGHVVAHELGHLLLGERSHSAAGLMKKRWSVVEKTHMRQRSLSFRPEEATRLRSALLMRVAARSSARDMSPSPDSPISFGQGSARSATRSAVSETACTVAR